jgi:hypothetical protein
MNTDPKSLYAPSGLAHTLDATALTEAARTTVPRFLALTSRGLSVVAKIFDGIVERRDPQAKQINALLHGHERVSDSLERKIEDIALGRRTDFRW